MQTPLTFRLVKVNKIVSSYRLLLLSPAFLFLAQCHHASSGVTDARMDSLLQEKDYFRMQQVFGVSGNELSTMRRLYFKAYINNAFNRNLLATREIDTLLNEHSDSFADSVKVALLLLRENCHFKLYEYAAAAADDSIIIHQYTTAMDSAALADVKNNYLFRNSLRNTPRQIVSKSGLVQIPWKRNVLGLISISVSHDTTACSAIFDTRANISSTTQTYAKKLGLKIIPVHYTESSGITGIHFTTGLGVADSLYIGNTLFRNVVFQVMPDSILYIAPLKLTLNVIIGYPVIAALGEVHIFNDGQMVVPQFETETDLHNLAMDRLDPVISLKVWSDTHAFDFDLGAGTSNLYHEFYQRYQSRIRQQGIEKNVHFAGAGGITERKVYVLPSLPITLGNKTVTIDSAAVITKPVYPGQKLYGNIGVDFALQFKELILNFDKMYVKGD